MALFSAVRPVVPKISTNASRITSSATRARAYATAKKGGNVGKDDGKDAAVMRTKNRGFKGNRNAMEPSTSGKKEKISGVFLPMSASKLSNPIFCADRIDELNLQTFHPELLTTEKIGEAMRFPMTETDAIRIFGLPKNLLIEFRVLSKSCSVVRDITLTVLERLDAAGKRPSSAARMVLTGSPGCGKSVTLIQAVQYASANDWLVFYFPRTINTVNSTTGYVYDARTRTYLQPTYAYQTLQRFLTVNSNQLQSLTTKEDISIGKKPSIPKGTPLTELIAVGMKDQTTAPAVLSILMKELGHQTKYPVLLAIDDFQALYCKSSYRDPHFSRIKPYHLSMPRLLLEYASGKKSFARGAVLGAVSTSHTGFQTPIELEESLSLSRTPDSPYVERSTELAAYARGLTRISVPENLNVKEAASIFDVWMKDKALPGIASDELFMAKYSEAGGNARNFVWKGLLSTLSTT